MKHYDKRQFDEAWDQACAQVLDDLENAGITMEDYLVCNENDSFPIALRYFHDAIQGDGYTPMWESIAGFLDEWERENDAVVWHVSAYTNSEGADRIVLSFIDGAGEDCADTLYLDDEYNEWYMSEQGF